MRHFIERMSPARHQQILDESNLSRSPAPPSLPEPALESAIAAIDPPFGSACGACRSLSLSRAGTLDFDVEERWAAWLLISREEY